MKDEGKGARQMRVYLGLGSRCEIIPYVVFELLYSIYEMCSSALMGLHHPSYYIQRGATIITGYAPIRYLVGVGTKSIPSGIRVKLYLYKCTSIFIEYLCHVSYSDEIFATYVVLYSSKLHAFSWFHIHGK